MPLDLEKQYPALLNAIPKTFPDPKHAARIRAAVRLMRHTGLSIQDAVTLGRDRLQFDDKQKVYRVVTARQKTGMHVSLIIPTDLARELRAVANSHPQFIFWDHRGGQTKTVAKDWQKDYRRLFVAAGLDGFSSHCLRDTFAVDLLQHGVPLQEVSKALGHSNPMTTAKYYAPWVKPLQDRLDSFLLGVASPSSERRRKGRRKNKLRPQINKAFGD